MNNIEQFSIYTAKILEILYLKFPVPTPIDCKNIITDYLVFDKKEELKDLNIKIGIIEIAEHSFSELPKPENFDEKAENIKSQHKNLEDERLQDERKQADIYNGTISFLLDEKLIRACPEGGYRLTSKSFSHLHKTFKDGKLESEESSYISAIKRIFSNTSKTSKDVAVGVAVNIIPKLLGIC